MTQGDLSAFANALMQDVQDELKRQDIWMGSPLRMSLQRDMAMQCYFFTLAKLNWEPVARIQLDDYLLHELTVPELRREVRDQIIAALLLNDKAGGLHRGYPRG